MTDPTPEPHRDKHHDVALWAGVAAFFGSLLTIGAIDIFKPDDIIKFASSLLIAVITAGGVYSKQRLDDAKKEREGSPHA
jgi:hypothetical protein